MLRVAQRKPVSKYSDVEKWRLSFFILIWEVVPWCWKRIYVLAGELKVALDALKGGYCPVWDNLDVFFLGYTKATMLKEEKDYETPGGLVLEIEKELLKVLELSPPTEDGRKHKNARKRRAYLWKHHRVVYLLLRCCDDLVIKAPSPLFHTSYC